jgi:hypothetical protein
MNSLREVNSSVRPATMNPAIARLKSQSWTRIIRRVPYIMIATSAITRMSPTIMSPGLSAIVVPQLCKRGESAATPTIVSIGPRQTLAENTPQ